MIFTLEDLKNIKITINRKIEPMDKIINESVDYGFSNEEKLNVHIRDSEGKKTLFEQINTNTQYPFFGLDRAPSEISMKPDSPHSLDRRRRPEPHIKDLVTKLETMVDEMKQKLDKPHDREPPKRPHRSTRKRGNSSSSCSRSPSPKRSKRDSRFGHSSKFDSDASTRSHRYPPSPSSESYSQYMSRQLESNLSTFLKDSYLSTDSSSSYDARRREKRHRRSGPYRRKDSYEEGRSYDDRSGRYSEKKSGGRYDDKYDYDRNYQPRSTMTLNDMKERYARYYTVMYAFTIIMEILQKDDLYNM